MLNNLALNNLESLLICFALVCSITDILEEKIYNIVTLPVLYGGILFHMLGVFYPEFSSQTLMYFGKYLGLGFVWFLIWFVLYAFRIVAGGDVKFFVAIYAWTGPPTILVISAYILIASGVLALIYLIEDRRLVTFVKSGFLSLVSGVKILNPDIHYQRPLGYAMLLGTAAYILWK